MSQSHEHPSGQTPPAGGPQSSHTPPPGQVPPASQQTPPPAAQPFGQPQQQWSQPAQQWSQPPQNPYAAPPAYGQGAMYHPQQRPGPSSSAGGAPGTVRAAALLTMVSTGLVTLLFGLLLLALAVMRDELMSQVTRELERNPAARGIDITANELAVGMAVVLVITVVWSLIAFVLAVLTWRGHNWARITLIISAAVATLLSLLSLPGSIPVVLAAGATIILLLLKPSQDYFNGRRGGWSTPQQQFPGQLPHGQASYGQSPYGHGPYEQPPHGQAPHAQSPYGQSPYGQSPYGQPSQGQQPTAPYGQAPHAQQPPTQAPPEDPTRDEDGKPPVW